MERADKGLAFMMQYENVAWYDSGEVRILDRRVYHPHYLSEMPANADTPTADEETAQRAPRRPNADKAYQGLL